MKMNSAIFRELFLKQHSFRSELSEADALECVVQFAILASIGFPVIAGFTHETVEDGEKGVQVLFPDFEMLSKVSHEDMRIVEQRIAEEQEWSQVSIERGAFYNGGFKGRCYRLKLLY